MAFTLAQSGNNQLIVMPADANYILTADEAANVMLRITSAVPLLAQRDVQLPLFLGITGGTVHPYYLVHNVTTGGQNIQLIGSSGTGVVLANGSKAIVYTDGTNYY